MLKLINVRWAGGAVILACIALGAPSIRQSHTAPSGSESLYDLVLAISKKVDLQGNGRFTEADIDRAMLDHSIKGREAIALVVLRDRFRELSGNKAVLDLSDLKQFQKGVAHSNLTDSIDERFRSAEVFLKNVNRELYPAGTRADSLAKMRSVNQVGRGNCYFLSGIGSLAAVDPEAIRKCIKDNGVDTERGVRTYTIEFPREPGRMYVVDDLSDAALLFAEVTEDSGTWAAIMTRGYGQFMKAHCHVRLLQRTWYRLDRKVLPEDLTDHGSMNNEGLRMVMDSRSARLRRVVWGYDDAHVASVIKDLVDGALPDGSPLAKLVLQGALLPIVKQVIASISEPRDEALVHNLLKKSICDDRLPGTVVKSGGAHEVSIIGYTPGTKTQYGKRVSQYGFVTIRDQAGLYDDEQKNVRDGIWWREPGCDDKTITMTVEQFTATFCGFNVVLRR